MSIPHEHNRIPATAPGGKPDPSNVPAPGGIPASGVPARDGVPTRRGAFLALWVALAAGLAAGAGAQEHTQTFRFGEDHLHLVNMIGAITVEPAAGNEFEVEVAVRGQDAEPGLLEFEADRGRNSEMVILFPLDDERTYVYPPMGRGSHSTFRYPRRPGDDCGWADWLGLGKDCPKVKVKGSGRGLEVWADVTVRVPPDRDLRVRHGVGSIRAEAIRGSFEFDLNSGDVEVRHVDGDLRIDTGSGDVAVADIRADLSIDTGSGSVRLMGGEGRSLVVDTGSGSVKSSDLIYESIVVDTGSGGVRATSVAAESVSIDTGSGSVRLELDRMGRGDFEIDTGSGGIDLRLAEGASARVRASTGSGGIEVDLDGTRIRNSEDDLSFKVGGGDAYVHLDTGSGGIRIWQ